MQLSSLLLAAVGVASVAADVSLPPCGLWCTNNITNSATAYGCQSSTDFHCLCGNVTFGYAVHDCSQQLCQNTTAADIAIAWAISVCSSAGVPITLPSASASVAPGATDGVGGPMASTVVSTVISGDSTFTTSYVTTAAAGGSPTDSASATGNPGLALGSGSPAADGSPTPMVSGTGMASPTDSANATDGSGPAVSSSATSAGPTAAGAMPTNVPGTVLYLAAGMAAALL